LVDIAFLRFVVHRTTAGGSRSLLMPHAVCLGRIREPLAVRMEP